MLAPHCTEFKKIQESENFDIRTFDKNWKHLTPHQNGKLNATLLRDYFNYHANYYVDLFSIDDEDDVTSYVILYSTNMGHNIVGKL